MCFGVKLRRTAAIVLFLVGAFCAASGTAIAATADLVVVHGDGSVKRKTVAFDEESITGIDLLRRSGLSVSIIAGSAGEAVYMIDGEGDPNGWVTRDGKDYYWNYFRVAGGKWVYSPLGAGLTKVRNGDVQGWLWQYYGQGKKMPEGSEKTGNSVISVTVKSGNANDKARKSAPSTSIGAIAAVFAVPAALGLFVFIKKLKKP